ncbi:MAG: glutathione S-transferase family protein [Pseudomonadota bacterium]
MLKVWGRASSSNVQSVMWCIGELGLPHERIDAGLMYGVNSSDEYLAMNPNGTIPTLIDGDGPPLWESGAVVRYLANKYGKDPFWPSDAIARADVDRWAEWGKVSVQMNFNAPIFWPVVRLPEQDRDDTQLRNAIVQFENKLAIADQRLAQHEFLVGDDFTVADIQFGHILYRYYELEIERGALVNVGRYYQMLTDRPQFRQHVMISFDELRPG